MTEDGLKDVRDTLTNRMATHRIDLERLVEIPSVSAQGFDPAEVRRSAEAVRDLLAARGLEDAQLLEVEGAHPAVYAQWLHAGPGAPTVLLYAHHDVQPPGDPQAWSSPAFEPTERDGRLYGRGVADDKAGILVHVAALDAWLATRGMLPLNVKLIVEGEEETGSEHLAELLSIYGGLLSADALVVTDSANWKVGVPAITYSLRGLVDCVVQVRGLDHALHSGMYGGPVPDPVTGLIKLLAAMTDDRGVVAIPGFADDRSPLADSERQRLERLDFDLGEFRRDAGLLPSVDLGGDPDASVLERLWLRPNITVIGFDAPAVDGASNTLVPSARARLSARLAPGQDPDRARAVLTQWLKANVPWGLELEVIQGAAGSPYMGDPEHPVLRAAALALEAAYGHPAVFMGVGGSIPFMDAFVHAFDGIPAVLTGVGDPDTRAHGIDESLHLGDWWHACLGETYMLGEVASALAAPESPQPAGPAR